MWEAELQLARKAAFEAGKALMRYWGKANRASKKSEVDIVTEADLEAEGIILGMIRERFPDDRILSEEAGRQGGAEGRIWIVDPLDGTLNFSHSFRFFGVSIALEENGRTVMGIVHDPLEQETYEACRGKGALLNGERIQVSEIREMNDALMGTGFPYDIRQDPERVFRNFRNVTLKVQAVRRPGSAALDLCYVAAGRFDGFWEERLNPWDTAAAALIVEEAGGLVTTYEGTPFSPYDKSIVAANPYLHGTLLEILQS